MFHKRLLKEFKDNQKYVAGMILTQWIKLLANVILVFVTAGYLGKILNAQITMQDTWLLLITLTGVIIIRGIMTFWNNRMSYEASSNVKRRLRMLVYKKIMKMGSGYCDAVTTSEAVQISTEGVEQLEIYFGKYIPQFFYSLLAPVTLFVIVSSMSMKVALVLLICVPLIPLSIVAVQKFAKKLLSKYWGTYTGLGDSFLENLQGLTTLKIYQADERYAKKMDEEAEQFRKITMRVLIMQLNSISVMDLVAYGGAALGIILSILEFQAGNILFSECFFIILIAAEFFLPLRLLGSFFHIAMNGNAAANKIFALLDCPEPENGKVTVVNGDDIQFSGVNFGYTEKQVLDDITLNIPAKSFTALVGMSGCGKSTIASLIMGDYKVCQGTVNIGEVEVRDINYDTLYKKITRIRHDSYLFQGTVLENLRMGNQNATESDMNQALKLVDLYETIQEKGGLSMQIEEKASNLSGGQKQRMSLARAILHDSDIYIFDEATSNIDVESENKIMEAIHTLAKQKTVILISHRLANVIVADQILVMDQGRIIEHGKHEELLSQNGYYSKLYDSQKELERYTEKEAV